MVALLRCCFIVTLSFLNYFVASSITGERSSLLEDSSLFENNNTGVRFEKSLLASKPLLEEFQQLIEMGKLSVARRKALDLLHNLPPTKYERVDLAKAYVETFQKCYDAEGKEYLRKIRNALDKNDQQILIAKKDSPNCLASHSNWNFEDPYDLWDESCSILPPQIGTVEVRPAGDFFHSPPSLQEPFFQSSLQVQCCMFTPGSWTYLRLPAIHEPAVRLGIPYNHLGDAKQSESASTDGHITYLNLEQDGYLRPYDVSGILWPTGYMLSLCLGDIVGCPVPELRSLISQFQQSFTSSGTLNGNELFRNHPPFALELGAGIGASR